MPQLTVKIYLISDQKKAIAACTHEKASDLLRSGIASHLTFTGSHPFIFVESIRLLRMVRDNEIEIFEDELKDIYDFPPPSIESVASHKPLNKSQISDLMVKAAIISQVPPENRTLKNYYDPLDIIRSELIRGIPGMTDPPPERGPTALAALRLQGIFDNALLTGELDSIRTIQKIQSII